MVILSYWSTDKGYFLFSVKTMLMLGEDLFTAALKGAAPCVPGPRAVWLGQQLVTEPQHSSTVTGTPALNTSVRVRLIAPQRACDCDIPGSVLPGKKVETVNL